MAEFMCKTILKIICIRITCSGPVSYTHLDVYKRQVQNSTDESRLLGKFLYYSLADVLVEQSDFERICTALGFPYAGRRISEVDAFRNATGRVTRRTV